MHRREERGSASSFQHTFLEADTEGKDAAQRQLLIIGLHLREAWRIGF